MSGSTVPNNRLINTKPSKENRTSAASNAVANSPAAVIAQLHRTLAKLYNPLSWPEPDSEHPSNDKWYLDFRDGKEALERKKYKMAVHRFSEALSKGYRIKSESITSEDKVYLIAVMLKRRSFALYKLDRLEDALSDIDIAIRILLPDRNDPHMHLLATDIKLAMGDYHGALISCQQGLHISLKRRKTRKRKPTETETEVLRIFEQLIYNNPRTDANRQDPFDRVSPDVIELVMQYGLQHDEYFALKWTWTSRLWKQTLESMPSIWRAYTYDGVAEIRTVDEKRAAWAQNAKNRFNEITLRNVDTYAALMDVNDTCLPYFPNMHTLKLTGSTLRDLNVVRYLAESFSSSYFVKALHLRSRNSQEFYELEVDLGIITPENRETLQELHLVGLAFDPYRSPVRDRTESAFATLRVFSLRDCHILPGARIAMRNEMHAVEYPVQQDHVHATLRRAHNLETLIIALDFDFPTVRSLSPYPTSYSREMTLLKDLHTLRIPPPCTWSIDIRTPWVRHLAFIFNREPIRTPPAEHGNSTLSERDRLMGNGLVPSLASFAPTGIDVSKLVTVELIINGGDTAETLREWLENMKRVEKLTVVSVKLAIRPVSQLSYEFAPKRSRFKEEYVGRNPANTYNRNLITLLSENPLLCPSLRGLCLSDMRTPEAPLLAWIRARKTSDTAASPISTLSLKHCTFISNASKHLLQQEVSAVHIVEPSDITRLNWRELCEKWDQSFHVAPPDKGCTQPSDQMQI